MFKGRKRGLAVAALAAGLLAAGAWAQAPDRGPQPGVHPESQGSLRGMGRLYHGLNLTPQQQELWNKAKGAQRQAFRDLRAKRAEMRAELRVEIDKPGVDLKKFAEFGDRLRERMRAQTESARKQVRDAWFAVYDTLDPAQKERVRVAIRDGMDHVGGRSWHRRGEWRDSGGWGEGRS